MKTNKIDHICIAVRNLEEARKAWEPLLGKTEPDDAYVDEREKINERMTRGRHQKVRSGSVLVSGKPPYGYRLVKDEDGRQILELDEDQASIVRLVFTWYLEGDESGNILLQSEERQLDSPLQGELFQQLSSCLLR